MAHPPVGFAAGLTRRPHRRPHHPADDEPEGVAPGGRHRARQARADGVLEDRRERVPEAGIMASVDALEAMAGGDGLETPRPASEVGRAAKKGPVPKDRPWKFLGEDA